MFVVWMVVFTTLKNECYIPYLFVDENLFFWVLFLVVFKFCNMWKYDGCGKPFEVWILFKYTFIVIIIIFCLFEKKPV